MLYLCYSIKLKPILTILLIALLLACNKPAISVEKPDYYYVLKGNENNMYDVRDTTKLIGKAYYGTYNFTLCGDTGIYLHTRFIQGWICGTGRELIDQTKPEYIRLTPDSIKRLNICSLDRYLTQIFAEANSSTVRKPSIVISIVSTIDTIRNSSYAILKSHIERASLKQDLQVIWTIRKITEQERITIDYKFSNKPFNIDNINWKESFSNEIVEEPIED